MEAVTVVHLRNPEVTVESAHSLAVCRWTAVLRPPHLLPNGIGRLGSLVEPRGVKFKLSYLVWTDRDLKITVTQNQNIFALILELLGFLVVM